MPHDLRIETYHGPRDELRALFELAEDSAAELDSYLDASGPGTFGGYCGRLAFCHTGKIAEGWSSGCCIRL